ncbi:MAG: alpha-galactosidase [Pseudomonadota bacterium]
MKTWRLDTPRQTLVLAASDEGLPAVVYWAEALPEGEDLTAVAGVHAMNATGGGLDWIAPISVCPGGDAFLGHPGLSGPTDRIRWRWAPRPDWAETRETAIEEAFACAETGLSYRLKIEADPGTEVFAFSAELGNTGDARPVTWLAAPVLAMPATADLMTFSGRWCGEFGVTRTPWRPGILMTEGREGRTGHSAQPGAFALGAGAGEHAGRVWGLTLAWSGGHRMVAEELPTGQRQIQLGEIPRTRTLEPRTIDRTPVLYGTFSDRGLNGASQAFHTHLRRRVLRYAHPERPRPVHYNCWEAVYFDHDVEVLRDLADRAHDLSVERFVLDDGWFRGRDDATTSLGDWDVDPRKWPQGLWPLVDHVTNLGMSFGLWVEPEMVNAESALFRAHPDWILGPADQTLGRTQYVLDLSHPGVGRYVFEALDRLLSEYPVDYLKWDHNRPLPPGTGRSSRPLYDLLDRVRTAHPGVEIETCASGGGRIDFGILAHTQRMWLSDSNDALERARIQRGASYFFPPEITGSHVGPRTCHTSGRTLSMAFRAGVAGTRAMGIEADLRDLDRSEFDTLRAAVERFKARRGLLHTGRLHRLETSDTACLAEMHVATDGAAFLLFAMQLTTSGASHPAPLRLAGLGMDDMYRITLEGGEAPQILNRSPAGPLGAGGSVVLSGRALTSHGIRLPNAFPETLWTLEGVRL